MVVTVLTVLVLGLMEIIIGALFLFIPTEAFTNGSIDITTVADLLRNVTVFVPSDVLFMLVSSVVLWYVARLVFAVLEFVWNKIPFLKW